MLRSLIYTAGAFASGFIAQKVKENKIKEEVKLKKDYNYLPDMLIAGTSFLAGAALMPFGMIGSLASGAAASTAASTAFNRWQELKNQGPSNEKTQKTQKTPSPSPKEKTKKKKRYKEIPTNAAKDLLNNANDPNNAKTIFTFDGLMKISFEENGKARKDGAELRENLLNAIKNKASKVSDITKDVIPINDDVVIIKSTSGNILFMPSQKAIDEIGHEHLINFHTLAIRYNQVKDTAPKKAEKIEHFVTEYLKAINNLRQEFNSSEINVNSNGGKLQEENILHTRIQLEGGGSSFDKLGQDKTELKATLKKYYPDQTFDELN